MGLIELRIAVVTVTDITQHDFINWLLQRLQKRTYSSLVAIRPIAMREDFAELHRFLQLQKGLRQTIEADLSFQNAMNPKVILEYSVNQLDFSFMKKALIQDSNLPFHSMD